ncbi:hypothetical protein TNCV_4946121 [Trichonephila clavipes]|nr:hypothetical protein TNCV_4946121 [Trichonephila clavipes]
MKAYVGARLAGTCIFENSKSHWLYKSNHIKDFSRIGIRIHRPCMAEKGLSCASTDTNRQQGSSHHISTRTMSKELKRIVGDRLKNTFTKDFCVRITNTYSDNEHFQERVLFLDNEHIFGNDQEDPPEIMDDILTTARDLESEVNEDDIEELIMGHEDELTIEKLQEILNEEHQGTQRNVSPF